MNMITKSLSALAESSEGNPAIATLTVIDYYGE